MRINHSKDVLHKKNNLPSKMRSNLPANIHEKFQITQRRIKIHKDGLKSIFNPNLFGYLSEFDFKYSTLKDE
jgi:hypothetical protein